MTWQSLGDRTEVRAQLVSDVSGFEYIEVTSDHYRGVVSRGRLLLSWRIRRMKTSLQRRENKRVRVERLASGA